MSIINQPAVLVPRRHDLDVAGGDAHTVGPPPLGHLLRTIAPQAGLETFGALIVFWCTLRFLGLAIAAAAATAVSICALVRARRHGRSGVLTRLGAAMIAAQAIAALVGQNVKLFLAPHALHAAVVGALFLTSVRRDDPFAARLADDTYPLDDFIRTSPAVVAAFRTVSFVWGVFLIGRAALRTSVLYVGDVDRFLITTLATGAPVMSALLAWSVWHVRRAIIASTPCAPNA